MSLLNSFDIVIICIYIYIYVIFEEFRSNYLLLQTRKAKKKVIYLQLTHLIVASQVLKMFFVLQNTKAACYERKVRAQKIQDGLWKNLKMGYFVRKKIRDKRKQWIKIEIGT